MATGATVEACFCVFLTCVLVRTVAGTVVVGRVGVGVGVGDGPVAGAG